MVGLQKVLQFLTPRQKPIIAIDISSTAVKVLELGKNGSHSYSVERFGVASLPPEAVVDKAIRQPDVVSDAIGRAVDAAKVTTKDAAVAVADSLVISKWISVDASLSDEEIETQVSIDAEKFIPYPLEEISLDFEVRRDLQKNEKFLDVILVASRREHIESRLEVISNAGLNLKIVDVESYAIERVWGLLQEQLKKEHDAATIAILDVGSVMTNLTVLQNNMPIFTREEAFGGEQLTRDIMRHYNMTYEQAGLAKKQGNLPADYVTEVLNPFKESAVLQVKRALQFFYSASDYSKVDQIVLAGGTSQTSGLCDMIANELAIPTLIANPFSDMMISSQVNADELLKQTSALVVCCGLALRGFDA